MGDYTITKADGKRYKVFAVADVVPPNCTYITAGKEYELTKCCEFWGWASFDDGIERGFWWCESPQLDGGNWRRVERLIEEPTAQATPASPTATPSTTSAPRSRMIYIASRMRGVHAYNFPAFDAMRDKLTGLGWPVVSPADIDRSHGFDAIEFAKQNPDWDWNALPNGLDYEEIMLRDFDALAACGSIMMFGDWRHSEGAQRELDKARKLGLTVYVEEDLPLMGPLLPDVDPTPAHDAKQVQEQAPADDGLAPIEVRITDALTGGQKGLKPERYDLLPVEPLAELARHYGVGARKYADHNYRKGYKWSLSYAALQRHLNAFWRGEDIDAETGSKHVIAAAFHCLALAEYMDTRRSHDDRYVRERHQAEGGANG